MMSAKMPSLGLLKIFWNTYFLFTTSPATFYHVTQIIDVVMWPKFDNSIVSMGEVIITSIL